MKTGFDANSARHEIKFVTSPLSMLWIENWVRSHPAGFFEPYPSRQVNNVYFDGFGLGAYQENLSGASSRDKVRLRWYGEVEDAESGVIEVKRRRSGLGWKLSFDTGSIFLEAHKQNAATGLPAQDATAMRRFGELTAADA